MFKRLGALTVVTAAFALAIPLASPANAAPVNNDNHMTSFMRVGGGLGCC